jgi:hypothetical protein
MSCWSDETANREEEEKEKDEEKEKGQKEESGRSSKSWSFHAHMDASRTTGTHWRKLMK